jgi:nitrile hydratase accessory protein
VTGPKRALLPGQPQDADGPVFREAWEAQAFAMALALHERGVFTWKEWASALGEAIKAAQADGDPDLGLTYYIHWLTALEQLVVAKGVTLPQALQDTARAWTQAARATPHGKPIVLDRSSRA